LITLKKQSKERAKREGYLLNPNEDFSILFLKDFTKMCKDMDTLHVPADSLRAHLKKTSTLFVRVFTETQIFTIMVDAFVAFI